MAGAQAFGCFMNGSWLFQHHLTPVVNIILDCHYYKPNVGFCTALLWISDSNFDSNADEFPRKRAKRGER